MKKVQLILILRSGLGDRRFAMTFNLLNELIFCYYLVFSSQLVIDGSHDQVSQLHKTALVGVYELKIPYGGIVLKYVFEGGQFFMADGVLNVEVNVVGVFQVDLVMQQLVIHLEIKVIVGKALSGVINLRFLYDDRAESQISGKEVINQVCIVGVLSTGYIGPFYFSSDFMLGLQQFQVFFVLLELAVSRTDVRNHHVWHAVILKVGTFITIKVEGLAHNCFIFKIYYQIFSATL